MQDTLVLAPLEGMTDPVFRRCYYAHFRGLDRALAPFLPIPDGVLRVPPSALREVAPPGSAPLEETPQLLVSAPEAFLTAAAALERAGFREVNWNLGCPSRGVVNKGKGAGLLPRTEEILRLLDRVLPRTALKVSLKIRLGLREREESYRLVRRLKGYPLSELICHPRLGVDGYRGEPDLEGFAALVACTDLPLVYSGDILTVEDFRAKKALFSRVERWMIGRGLLRDPFLAERIKGLAPAASAAPPLKNPRFRSFLEGLYTAYGETIPREEHRIGRMKGFLFFVVKTAEQREERAKRIGKIATGEEFREYLQELFGP